MPQRIDIVFAEANSVLTAGGFTLADVLEYVHSAAAGGNLLLVTALTGHMKDISVEPTDDLDEQGQEVISFSALLLGALRRALFDEEHAHKYGTEAWLQVPLRKRLDMVCGLTETYRLATQGDEAQQALALAVPASAHAH